MKEEFVDYVFSFYGPGEIYGNNFNHQLTREQVEFGVAVLKQHCYKNGIEFMGDSYDREYTLSIMLFWFVHDPTQLNRQGNDIGSQYRSVIFYHSEEQKVLSETIKNQLINDKVWEEPIVTEIVEMDKFYAAEDYHHNYFENNPQNMYCQSVVRPKVEKFKKVFSNIMK